MDEQMILQLKQSLEPMLDQITKLTLTEKQGLLTHLYTMYKAINPTEINYSVTDYIDEIFGEVEEYILKLVEGSLYYVDSKHIIETRMTIKDRSIIESAYGFGPRKGDSLSISETLEYVHPNYTQQMILEAYGRYFNTLIEVNRQK